MSSSQEEKIHSKVTSVFSFRNMGWNPPPPQQPGYLNRKEEHLPEAAHLESTVLWSRGQNSGWYRNDNIFLILLKGPREHIYRRRPTCTLTSIRGSLPLARWRKGTGRFIGLCGSHGLAQLWWTPMYPDTTKVCGSRTHLYFWGDSRIPAAEVNLSESGWPR